MDTECTEPEPEGPGHASTTAYSDELLIEMVRNRGNLFDKTRSDYKDEAAKAAAWGDIASAFNVRAEDCQTRWVRLRERFGREMRLYKRGTPPGKEWPLLSRMRWLERFIQPRNRLGRAQAVVLPQSSDPQAPGPGHYPPLSPQGGEMPSPSDRESDPDADHSSLPSLWATATDLKAECMSEATSPTRKDDHPAGTLDALARTARALELMVSEMDAEEMFARSLAASLRALPRVARTHAKIKMLTVLAEVESTLPPSSE